ncbi:hypothetical protein [Nocardioides sp.]|uniref:hypothetical protein n=1 Tax=Nocardioides sp. TaxID=35761 RepID=UPI0031FED6ED|nr:hypothetical protein [Nocardioides sp.]
MRSALDKLISGAGFLLATVLLIAAGLLTWANVFIANEVHDQLSQQNITMPEKAALETQAQHDALDQYAGQPLTTGPQAKAYADFYIAVHMDAMAEGKTYSEVSGEFTAMTDEQKASPEGQALGQVRQSMFMGDTLRGLLLYGFAFATMGTIALYAAIAAYVGAALMLLLSGLGLRHSRKTADAPVTRAVPVPA